MSLSFVNVATQNQTSGSVTTITCNVPTGTVDGDQMLLSVCHSVNRTISSGLSAWDLVREQAGTDGIHIYKRTASSEPASYTVTFSAGTQSSIGIIAWHSSTATDIVVDIDSAPQSNGTNTNIVWPSVDTTRPDSIVHFFGVFDFGSGNVTPDGACDERWDISATGHQNYLMTDAVAGTGATGTRTATIGIGAASRTITIAIAEDGGTTHNITPAGSVTPSGLLSKEAAKVFAGAVTPTGAVVKTPAKILAGSITPTGGLIRAITKALAGIVTPIGDLIAAKDSGAIVEKFRGMFRGMFKRMR